MWLGSLLVGDNTGVKVLLGGNVLVGLSLGPTVGEGGGGLYVQAPDHMAELVYREMFLKGPSKGIVYGLTGKPDHALPLAKCSRRRVLCKLGIVYFS